MKNLVHAIAISFISIIAFAQAEVQNPTFPFWKVNGNSNTNSSNNFIGTTDNVSLRFRTNNTQRVVFDSLGNVGIGVPAPIQTLDVSGTGLFRMGNGNIGTLNAQLMFSHNGTSNYPHALKTRHNGSADQGNAFDFFVWDQGTDATSTAGTKRVLTIDGEGTNGRVGIGGVSVPAYELDVLGSGLFRKGNTAIGTGNNQLLFSIFSGTDYRHAINTRHNGSADAGNAFDFWVWDQGTDAVATTGTKRVFTIDGNGTLGSVGIGTSTPATRLHVNGTDGVVRIGSLATGGSNIATAAATTDKLLYADANGDVKAIGNGTSGQVLTISGTGVPAWSTATGNFWSLTGNSGTVAGTNFIGTTDDMDIRLKRNSINSGLIGTNATFMGRASGNVNTGSYNTGFGGQTLQNNTTGVNNTALGYNSMADNTTGHYNTAVGMSALSANATGQYNTAVGQDALRLSTGQQNTAVGVNAGNTLATGDYNTFLGTNTDCTDGLTNVTAVGYNAQVTASNSLVLGNGANVGIGVTAPTQKLDVSGSGLFRMGNNNTGTGSNQLLFGYNGTSDYRHALKTRHNGGSDAGNAIDFFVWDQGTDATTTTGTKRVLTIEGNGTNGRVGIGNTASPAAELDVNGTTRTTNFQMTNGATNNYIMKSDATGNGSWVTLSSLMGNTAWSTTGNSGTNPSTNFMGTSDNTDIIFRRNNIPSGIINISNTFFGEGSGYSNTGSYNTGFGARALQTNTTATFSTAVGYQALRVSTGTGNTAVGLNALVQTTTGTRNTAVGLSAGTTITTGNYNTLLGNDADAVATLQNATAIGDHAYVSADNCLVLGSIHGVNNASANVNVGMGVSAPTQRLDVNGTGLFRMGNNNTGTINNQLLFSYDGSSDYAHAIKTRHNGASDAGNTIDFYVWDAGTDAAGTTGTKHVMSIDGNGNGAVGIGTTAPAYPLDVAISTTTTYPNYGYLAPSGAGVITGNSVSVPVSVRAAGRMIAAEFDAISDARIKNITSRTNNTEDLVTINKIAITNYTYIDTIGKGNRLMKKVIAQELEQVYPIAVNKMTDVVPDIYKVAEIKDCEVMVKNNLKAGDMVKLIFVDRTEVIKVMAATGNSFTVDLKDEGKVFVYGRQVDDFRTVDYEALSTLSISAIQQLSKENDEQNKAIISLQNDVQLVKRIINAEAGK